MTEKTPTLGSLETSDYTKRQLALQSLEFNLNNKVFSELFPELCDDIRDKLKDLQKGVATSTSTSSTSTPYSSTSLTAAKQPKEDSPIPKAGAPALPGKKRAEGGAGGGEGDAEDPGPFGILSLARGGAAFVAANVANIFVIVGFSLLAYTVSYVLGTVE